MRVLGSAYLAEVQFQVIPEPLPIYCTMTATDFP